MPPEDLVNEAVLEDTLRYCPNCDPKGENPIRTLPGTCSCGHTLCVLTPWTGERTTIGR